MSEINYRMCFFFYDISNQETVITVTFKKFQVILDKFAKYSYNLQNSYNLLNSYFKVDFKTYKKLKKLFLYI